MHVRNECVPRPSPGSRRRRGEERGHLCSAARLQLMWAAGAAPGLCGETRAGLAFRRDPHPGKGTRCDPDPQSSAGPGQRCLRLSVLPKCTALCAVPGRGSWPCRETRLGTAHARSEQKKWTGATATLSGNTGGAMTCQGYPELRGKELGQGI